MPAVAIAVRVDKIMSRKHVLALAACLHKRQDKYIYDKAGQLIGTKSNYNQEEIIYNQAEQTATVRCTEDEVRLLQRIGFKLKQTKLVEFLAAQSRIA